MDEYRLLFAKDYNVPLSVLAEYDNFWEMQKAAFNYSLQQVKGQPEPKPGAAVGLRPEDKVQTGEGAKPLTRELDEVRSPRDFREKRKAVKRELST